MKTGESIIHGMYISAGKKCSWQDKLVHVSGSDKIEPWKWQFFLLY